MVTDELSKTLQIWIDSLQQYDEQSFLMKPTDGSWSIGQVYLHLVNETSFFIAQARTCLSSDTNSNKLASPHGLQMLNNNSFPDERIVGPPSNQLLQQPTSKNAILVGLQRLSSDIIEIKELFEQSSFRGKSKHPGLQYLDSYQWCQFAEMHLRHHFRQKARIDNHIATITNKDNKNQGD